jgi:hypothetical protein
MRKLAFGIAVGEQRKIGGKEIGVERFGVERLEQRNGSRENRRRLSIAT